MDSIYILGAVVIVAYILQIIFGLKQLKHFNTTYSELRKKGRVAIGRRSGKIKAGTIVMFAVDRKGMILDAKRMQGVTVVARFKSMPSYIGQDIHYLDTYNPVVRKENKLLQIAIEDARELFLRIEAGNYKDVPKFAPVLNVGNQLKLLSTRLKLQFKK
ncbi:TPA: transcriptional regulator GutM [Streptococcus suis]|jgi:glucitol operon activator protein|uniref:Transcriptional regulator n=2 Tax=Streptococcus suis TaxID=1307 RepID=A0A345S4D3_STRSU|nr:MULTISPECIES: transcriptional regulator GutM [Streptococcus]AXI68425.1 transcriptional regulator [Streptococcus suis]MBL6504317.1 transcriptional regulator GutM [Streptococcus suis]MBM7136243.1 transcriptional regulator GutM [Streptococcus suis]MBM7205024.1 transcriptional regulator GutM [Streptococcus suis]MBM7282420.1 transcriptional regulator GutM [Streptococcus suis]